MTALVDRLATRPRAVAAVLLTPPLLWLCVVYLGSLGVLLANSFFAFDDFSGLVVPEFTLATYGALFSAANLEIVGRTAGLAAVVTVLSALLGFPVALYAAKHARGLWRPALYLAVMLPLWSSYLVKIYAWKLILAKEGVLGWIFSALGLDAALDAVLALPVIGGPSLSVSYIGMVAVFVYLWLPFMILPIQAALERVPATLTEAASDLGATPRQGFRSVVVPLAMPGVAAGSIFVFSLTLGDYIVPQIVGPPGLVLGQAVYVLQGAAGNIPLAAAFAMVPVLVMAVYLTLARRLGAFDAL